MKKLSFYTLVAEQNELGCAKVKVNGWEYEEGIALYQDTGTWFSVDLPSGRNMIEYAADTRKEAIEKTEKARAYMDEFRKTDKYKKAVEIFERAPVKGE